MGQKIRVCNNRLSLSKTKMILKTTLRVKKHPRYPQKTIIKIKYPLNMLTGWWKAKIH